MAKVAIIGSGGFGCSIGILLNKNNHEVKIWSYSQNEIDQINKTHENKDFLPGIKIPESIFFSNDSEEILSDAEFIINALPSKFVRATLKNFSFKPNQKILNVSKGIEDKTFMRMSEVIYDVTKNNNIAALSGPTHAEEVSKFLPTACVVASKNINLAHEIQKLFNNDFFRVYTSSDIIGVELGGTLKNIIALATGISDGLGFGDNTRASLITRGLIEISRFGEKMGAKPETFNGLSGLGDLITTCVSEHGRNRRAGILLGQGMKLDQVVEKIKMVVEGANNIKPVYELAKKSNLELPIIFEVHKILFEDKSPKQSVLDLMLRAPKPEQI